MTAAGFKPHPNPYDKEKEKEKAEQFSFKLLANLDLASALGGNVVNDWLRVNPREQKLTGPIMKAIADTWDDYPKEFFRVNRGILISAESVTYDKETNTAEIVLSDPRKHGVVDGGHTLRKVLEELIPATFGSEDDEIDDEEADEPEGDDLADNTDENGEGRVKTDRYLACEVWTGLTLEQVALMSQGRNTSRSVPPYAIMNLKGDFDPLKSAIEVHNPEYANKIVAFKVNEHVEGLPEFKQVSVMDILQLMMAMDITNSNSEDHPIEAYKNRAYAAKFFDERKDEYRKMFPLIGDFLSLYDKLREVVPIAYDDAHSRPRHWSKVLAGKGQKVDKRLIEPLYYLDPSGETLVMKSPNALFFPMFSAFRADLRVVEGEYQWCDGVSPTAWPEDEFHAACQRLGLKVAKAAKTKDSLHAVGRDDQVWATCYENLNSFLFENGRKKKS